MLFRSDLDVSRGKILLVFESRRLSLRRYRRETAQTSCHPPSSRVVCSSTWFASSSLVPLCYIFFFLLPLQLVRPSSLLSSPCRRICCQALLVLLVRAVESSSRMSLCCGCRRSIGSMGCSGGGRSCFMRVGQDREGKTGTDAHQVWRPRRHVREYVEGQKKKLSWRGEGSETK